MSSNDFDEDLKNLQLLDQSLKRQAKTVKYMAIAMLIAAGINITYVVLLLLKIKNIIIISPFFFASVPLLLFILLIWLTILNIIENKESRLQNKLLSPKK